MSGVQSYNYTTSVLIDILTKREYLYRQYFFTKGYTMNLPRYLTASPNNSLLQEVKSSFALIDPVSFSSEVSRELLYQNTTFLKFNLIREFGHVALGSISELPFNPSALNNYLFFYLFGSNKNTNLGKNLELHKNQYRPMKKRSYKYDTSTCNRCNRNANWDKTTYFSLIKRCYPFMSNTIRWYKDRLCTWLLIS